MAYTTINKSSDYFNTVTYTGTAGGQTISGVSKFRIQRHLKTSLNLQINQP